MFHLMLTYVPLTLATALKLLFVAALALVLTGASSALSRKGK